MFLIQESEKEKVTVFFLCTVVQNGRISDSREAGLAAEGWMGCPNDSTWTGSVELCSGGQCSSSACWLSARGCLSW